MKHIPLVLFSIFILVGTGVAYAKSNHSFSYTGNPSFSYTGYCGIKKYYTWQNAKYETISEGSFTVSPVGIIKTSPTSKTTFVCFWRAASAAYSDCHRFPAPDGSQLLVASCGREDKDCSNCTYKYWPIK